MLEAYRLNESSTPAWWLTIAGTGRACPAFRDATNDVTESFQRISRGQRQEGKTMRRDTGETTLTSDTWLPELKKHPKPGR